uniref:Uncharacterized protein n=1 Tax=Triticum urartu TaxID=4572 RepID=A0A8R7V861_TRIUA
MAISFTSIHETNYFSYTSLFCVMVLLVECADERDSMLQARSMLSRQHRPIHIQEICHQLPQGPASSTQDILCPKPYRIMPSLISAVGMTASNFSLQY